MKPNQKTSKQKPVENCQDCPSRGDSLLCSHPEASALIEKAKLTCTYEKDQTIFHQGQKPVGLYSIQSGLVKLEVLTDTGIAHTIRLLGPGDVLGYRSLFADDNYHASAVALQPTTTCFIPKNEVLSLFTKLPELTMRLLCHMSQDLKLAEDRWVDQVDKGAQSRIAEALLFLTENFTDAQWTRKEIAQWAGTTPETVIRTLADFEHKGLVSQNGRQISVLSKTRLTSLANGKLI